MFIDVPGGKLFATHFGPPHAVPIVGLGGWIGNWEVWAEPFSFLSATRRVVAYDHRGSGASVCQPHSIQHETLVRDLLVVLDSLNIPQCVLAAESAGALTALDAALRWPERVRALVIVDGLTYRPPQGHDPFLDGLRTQYEQTLDSFAQWCVPGEDQVPIRRWGRQIISRADQNHAIALYLSANGIDLRAQFPNLKQPTLILHGSQDVIVPLAAAQQLHAKLPSAQLIVLEGAGHVPTLTHPAQVAQTMLTFLDRLST